MKKNIYFSSHTSKKIKKGRVCVCLSIPTEEKEPNTVRHEAYNQNHITLICNHFISQQEFLS